MISPMPAIRDILPLNLSEGVLGMGAKAIFHEGKWRVQVNLEGKSRMISRIRQFIRNPEFSDELIAKCLESHVNTVIEHCSATCTAFPWERFFPQDAKKYRLRLLSMDWLSRNWKPATYYLRNRIITKHVLPRIGNLDVRKFHRNDFQWIRREFGDTPKARSIRDVIQGFLNWCYAEEYRTIPIKLPPISIGKKPLPYISRADRDRIQAEVHPDYRAATLLSLRMGLRSNEIAALEWDQIEWGKGIIIKRGMSNYRTTTPKEGGSRFSPFQGEVEYSLRGIYESLKEKGVLPTGLVFRLSSGARLWPNLISWNWTRAARKAGVKAHMHLNRHSLGQDMLAEGFNLGEVAAILGHRSQRVTEQFYARHNRGSLVKIADKRRNDRIKDN